MKRTENHRVIERFWNEILTSHIHVIKLVSGKFGLKYIFAQTSIVKNEPSIDISLVIKLIYYYMFPPSSFAVCFALTWIFSAFILKQSDENKSHYPIILTLVRVWYVSIGGHFHTTLSFDLSGKGFRGALGNLLEHFKRR